MTSTHAPPKGRVDQRVVLHGATWADYERLLELRGERSVPRITYLEGEIELMTPSVYHERIKKMIARLLEAWAVERRVPLNAFGSWTIRKKIKQRGLEPDECYTLDVEKPKRPDLAIEVAVTSGFIDKIEVYRGLGVPELWTWEHEHLEVLVLRGQRYERVARSALLPELDLDKLAELALRSDQTPALLEWLELLRKEA